MYRFIRTATVKTAANQAAGMAWAAEVSAYLNKTYSLNLKYGAELFGKCRIHWHFDSDSLDKMSALNAKLLQDRDFQALQQKSTVLWVEGSLQDSVVFLAG